MGRLGARETGMASCQGPFGVMATGGRSTCSTPSAWFAQSSACSTSSRAARQQIAPASTQSPARREKAGEGNRKRERDRERKSPLALCPTKERDEEVKEREGQNARGGGGGAGWWSYDMQAVRKSSTCRVLSHQPPHMRTSRTLCGPIVAKKSVPCWAP